VRHLLVASGDPRPPLVRLGTFIVAVSKVVIRIMVVVFEEDQIGFVSQLRSNLEPMKFGVLTLDLKKYVCRMIHVLQEYCW
jgi:hypothetical protein